MGLLSLRRQPETTGADGVEHTCGLMLARRLHLAPRRSIGWPSASRRSVTAADGTQELAYRLLWRKAAMAAVVSPGSLRCGQWPVASSRTIVALGMTRSI